MKDEIDDSSPITNPKKLIIIIRHGERKDRAGETPKYHRMNSELTEKGKLQSFNVSKTFLEEIKKYGITDISPYNIQIRTSPYLRTIQTAVYFIKGLNEIFSNNKNNNKLLNKLYIDFSLRKTIKKSQKREDEDSSLYSHIDAYHIFDKEIKNIELIKENSNFPTEVESREQSEKRTTDYVNTVLKKEVEDNNECKIIVIIGHRGPTKNIFKKLGYVCTDKKEVDYCSQFYFDVSNGIENAKFLGKQNIPKNIP